MVTIGNQTYYTVEDVLKLAKGTEENARRHCRIVAEQNPEWRHYHHCPHLMSKAQYVEVLKRIRDVGRRSRGKPKQKTRVISVPSLF